MERKPEQPRAEAMNSRELWVPRMEVPIAQEFFEFQFGVAKIIAARRGISLTKSLDRFAPMVFRNAFMFDKERDRYVRRPELTADNIIEVAYAAYLEQVDTANPVPYNDEKRFGCMMWSYDPIHQAAAVHFVNAEYDTVGPLDHSKLALRRSEVADVIRDVCANRPDVLRIQGHSWLYNLDAYRRLYPASYTRQPVPDTREAAWQRGTQLWGQFLDSDMQLNKERARILTDRLKEEPADTPMHELMEYPLMLPLQVSAPIKDFYQEYEIK